MEKGSKRESNAVNPQNPVNAKELIQVEFDKLMTLLNKDGKVDADLLKEKISDLKNQCTSSRDWLIANYSTTQRREGVGGSKRTEIKDRIVEILSNGPKSKKAIMLILDVKQQDQETGVITGNGPGLGSFNQVWQGALDYSLIKRSVQDGEVIFSLNK